MSSKILQLSPQASTRTRRKIAVQESWSAAPARPLDISLDLPLDLSLDIGFLRAWFETESDTGQSSPDDMNWGAISGMALSLAFSVICWAGVAWMITRVWR